jgi:hypothetical protein
MGEDGDAIHCSHYSATRADSARFRLTTVSIEIKFEPLLSYVPPPPSLPFLPRVPD